MCGRGEVEGLRRERVLWRIIGRIGAALLVTILSAIQGAPPEAAPAKVVVGFNSGVRSFGRVNTMDVTTDRVIGHNYQYLFTRDHEMKIIPLLAESARVVGDLTWEIKLKKGVPFSDRESPASLSGWSPASSS